MGDLLTSALLGLLEGLTEFLPVSSTGHLLLASHFLGFESAGKTFEVVIQLGAVLAVVWVYFARLWRLFVTLPSDPASRRFVLGILIAFLPAALFGALAHDFIKTVLFETPVVICIALIIGGIALLAIDRMPIELRYKDVTEFPLSLCLKIGRKLVVGVPKANGCAMDHSCFARPARTSLIASSASESSMPLAASRAISRSNSHARISSTCSSLSFSIALSIS